MTEMQNGIDMARIQDIVDRVRTDPKEGCISFKTVTQWAGGTLSQTQARQFTVTVDEPTAFSGRDQALNPQEMLLSGLAACLCVGLAAGCAGQGIRLEALRIEAEGDLDLRGFLDLDAHVRPGFQEIRYLVRVKANVPATRIEEILQHVEKTSPNRSNLSAIPMRRTLVLDSDAHRTP
jgi:uncharacterized OsmC-like protein